MMLIAAILQTPWDSLLLFLMKNFLQNPRYCFLNRIHFVQNRHTNELAI